MAQVMRRAPAPRGLLQGPPKDLRRMVRHRRPRCVFRKLHISHHQCPQTEGLGGDGKRFTNSPVAVSHAVPANGDRRVTGAKATKFFAISCGLLSVIGCLDPSYAWLCAACRSFVLFERRHILRVYKGSCTGGIMVCKASIMVCTILLMKAHNISQFCRTLKYV